MSTLWDRLTEQVGNRALAKQILIDRGHLTQDGLETPSGAVRASMTPEERALDRHIQKYGGSEEDYEYDPETNRVRKFRG